jgi:hypothetical protein
MPEFAALTDILANYWPTILCVGILGLVTFMCGHGARDRWNKPK